MFNANIELNDFKKGDSFSTVIAFEDDDCYLSVGQSGSGERVVNVRLKKLNLYITGGPSFCYYLEEKAGMQLVPFSNKKMENCAAHVLSYVFKELIQKDNLELFKIVNSMIDQTRKAARHEGIRENQAAMRAVLGL